jgi:hypothetical protein
MIIRALTTKNDGSAHHHGKTMIGSTGSMWGNSNKKRETGIDANRRSATTRVITVSRVGKVRIPVKGGTGRVTITGKAGWRD